MREETMRAFDERAEAYAAEQRQGRGMRRWLLALAVVSMAASIVWFLATGVLLGLVLCGIVIVAVATVGLTGRRG